MLSARAKRYVFNSVLAAVYIGIPIFFVLLVYPVLMNNSKDLEQLDRAESTLRIWMHKGKPPTQSRIDAERQYTELMRSEYERARNYYLRRESRLLRRQLLTHTNDPAKVKLEYDEFKKRLRAKARRYAGTAALKSEALLPAFIWEDGAAEPAIADFDLIEKKSAIAQALVDLLTTQIRCVVLYIAVEERVEVRDAPEKPDINTRTVRYGVWPVTVDYAVPFNQLGRSLHKVVTAPDEYPGMIVRGLHVEPAARNQVVVKLTLGVLDFG